MFKSSPSRYWIWRMNYAQLKGGEVSGSGDTYQLLPTDAQFIIRDSHRDFTSAFCEEGARKQTLRQNLFLLLQSFAEENSDI